VTDRNSPLLDLTHTDAQTASFLIDYFVAKVAARRRRDRRVLFSTCHYI
jgi:hypothetical protein